ncbi:MAG: bifunctional demethylmenaquinone methyltransferase/2-methoxy-6-polyprenyl-1,4-benzoquinol methylase UbiE [Cyanobacteriota bacterium]
MLNDNSFSYEKQEKSDIVRTLFDKIAPVYDLLNDIISLKQHKRWKKEAINIIDIKTGDKILDLCCGSGDVSQLIMENSPDNIEIFAVDFSESMIEKAHEKLQNFNNVKIICADAMSLPFEKESFDCIIISFGFRNLENLSKSLLEMNRVLKPGGTMVILDFGKPEKYVFKVIFDIYFNTCVPIIGKIFNNYNEYAYLPASIKIYPSPSSLIELISEAGFINVSNKDCFFGFVSIQKGIK